MCVAVAGWPRTQCALLLAHVYFANAIALLVNNMMSVARERERQREILQHS